MLKNSTEDPSQDKESALTDGDPSSAETDCSNFLG